jgi:hypothetical protein
MHTALLISPLPAPFKKPRSKKAKIETPPRIGICEFVTRDKTCTGPAVDEQCNLN